MDSPSTILVAEVSPLSAQSLALVITDQNSLQQATESLSRLNVIMDKITAEKERVTAPLNQALKAERSRWKPLETSIESSVASIRLKISEYQTNLINSQKAEQERIAARIGEGKGHLTLETAVKQIEALPTIVDKIQSDAGTIKFRTTKVLKILSVDKIPHSFFDLNESRLLTALKNGDNIEGATLEDKQTVVNLR